MMGRGVAVAFIAGCTQLFGLEDPQRRDAATVLDDEQSVDMAIDMGSAQADAAVDARMCPAAPAGCSAFTCAGSTSCYYSCGNTTQTEANWAGARTACAAANLGCIVTVNDAAEMSCITTNTTPVFPDVVWIGYRQPAGTNEPLDGWAWECGTSAYLPSTWGMAEPNEAGSEDCAAILGNGGWVDVSCSSSFRYACELP